MTLKERAEKYTSDYAIKLADRTLKPLWLAIRADREKAMADYEAGFREAIELATQKCATSSAGDCCHETAERNAEAIRALAEESK